MVYTDAPALLALGVPMLLLTIAGCLWPDYVPYSTLLIPMFLGSLWLGPRTLPCAIFACRSDRGERWPQFHPCVVQRPATPVARVLPIEPAPLR